MVCANRPRTSAKGEKMQAVEMTSLYFDNAKMRPMAYNIAMNASMWTGILTTETGLRKFLLTCCTASDFDGAPRPIARCVFTVSVQVPGEKE